MKKILFVDAEAMPFASTGGLGDVLGSLPAALAEAGKGDVDIRVILPLYSAMKPEWREKLKAELVFDVQLSWRRQYCGIHSLVKDGVTYYFVDNEYYFKRDGLYGRALCLLLYGGHGVPLPLGVEAGRSARPRLVGGALDRLS